MKIGKGTSLILFATLTGYAINFLYKIIVARWLGPTDFGILSLAVMLVGIMGLLFTFGIPSSVIKYVPEFLVKKKNPSIIFSSALKLLLPLSVFSSILLFLFAELLATKVFNVPQAVAAFQVTAFAVFFSATSRLFTSCINGFQKIDYLALIKVLERVALLLASIILLYAGFGVIGAALGLAFSYVAMSALGWFYSKKLCAVDFSLASRKVSVLLVKYGLPLYGSSIFNTVLAWTDTFMLGIFLTAEKVGYYNAAITIVNVLTIFAVSLITSLFPVFSELHARKDASSTQKVFNRSIKYSLYLAIPGAVGALILAEPIIRIVFGNAFVPASTAFKVLAFSAVFVSIKSIGLNYINGVGRTDLTIKFMALAFAANVLLNLALIPVLGIIGAAASFAATSLLLAFLTLWFTKKTITLSFNYLPSCLAASALMGVLVFLIKLSEINTYAKLAAIVAIGCGAYFAFLYYLKGFDETDKNLFKEFWKRAVNKAGVMLHSISNMEKE